MFFFCAFSHVKSSLQQVIAQSEGHWDTDNEWENPENRKSVIPFPPQAQKRC